MGPPEEVLVNVGDVRSVSFLHLISSYHSTLLGLSLPILPLLLPPSPSSSPLRLLSFPSPPLTCASGRPAGVIEATEECCCCCSSMLVNCDFSVSFSWSQMIKIHTSLALTLSLFLPCPLPALSLPSPCPLPALSLPSPCPLPASSHYCTLVRWVTSARSSIKYPLTFVSRGGSSRGGTILIGVPGCRLGVSGVCSLL